MQTSKQAHSLSATVSWFQIVLKIRRSRLFVLICGGNVNGALENVNPSIAVWVWLHVPDCTQRSYILHFSGVRKIYNGLLRSDDGLHLLWTTVKPVFFIFSFTTISSKNLMAQEEKIYILLHFCCSTQNSLHFCVCGKSINNDVFLSAELMSWRRRPSSVNSGFPETAVWSQAKKIKVVGHPTVHHIFR